MLLVLSKTSVIFLSIFIQEVQSYPNWASEVGKENELWHFSAFIPVESEEEE